MERWKGLIRLILRPGACWSLPIALLGVPDIIETAKMLISKNKVGNRYISDPSLRARISLYQGLLVNLFFVAFYAYASWQHASVWFGAIAAYHIMLSVMRFILLRSVRKATLWEGQRGRFHALRTYRFCGYLMFVLNMGMAGMMIQMIWQNKGYQYPGQLIYATAAYAFYCFITAIINMVKYRRMDNPVLSAAKMLGFASALMSMFALQTAMISQFGASNDDFRQVMNTASGGGVFLIVFCMAVCMVVHANRELKKIYITNS